MFEVGLSPDVPQEGGRYRFDLGLGLLEDAEGVEWRLLPGEIAPELAPEQLAGFDGLLLWGMRLTEAALEGADRLRIVARLGVGYDNVDIDACTERGIVVTIGPDGVRRPMAATGMLLVLALAHRLLIKDRIARSGSWNDKWDHVGQGLTGRTLGLIGAGNIGIDLLRLARPFELRRIAFDPYVTTETAAAEDFELVDLETLLRTSDFIVVLCPLNDQTRGLIGDEQLALMKPTSYFINIARGPIVDEQALCAALQEQRIAGAGLDVFEQEPADPANPILKLDNVICSPHALGHTDEIFLGIGESACRNVLAIARGQQPEYVVNPAALEHRRFGEEQA